MPCAATVSDRSGRYQLLALPVGEYELRVSKAGFEEQVRSAIHLAVGQEAEVDLSLRVGQVKQQVTVKEDAPIVNTATREISGLVGERQVKELPLNGRSYDLLLPLNPGIVNFTSQKTGGTGISNSTTANNFAVSGNRPQQNIFLLNGVEYSGAAREQHAARRNERDAPGRRRGARIQRAARHATARSWANTRAAR